MNTGNLITSTEATIIGEIMTESSEEQATTETYLPGKMIIIINSKSCNMF